MPNEKLVRADTGGRYIADVTTNTSNFLTDPEKAALAGVPGYPLSGSDQAVSYSLLVSMTLGGNGVIRESTPWKETTNPTIQSSSVIRIDKYDGIETKAVAGAPIRYGPIPKYGIIASVIDNGLTLDLTVEGPIVLVGDDSVVEVGSPDQIVVIDERIPGDMSVDTDIVNTNTGFEVIWKHPESEIVNVRSRVGEAATGADLLLQVANTTVGNEILTSPLNLAQATSWVSSGITVDQTKYAIDKNEKIFIKINQIGSTTPGADLQVLLYGVLQPFLRHTFIPIAPPFNQPYFFSLGGGNSSLGIAYNSMEYGDLDTNTGSSSDRGDLTVARSESCAVHDSAHTFNCAGGGAGTGTGSSNIIEYINTPAIIGDAVDRGDMAIAKNHCEAGESATHGFIIGGHVGSNVNSSIDTFDLSVLVGNSSSTASLIISVGGTGHASMPGKIVVAGGLNGLSYQGINNQIQYLDSTVLNSTSDDRGDLLTNNGGNAAMSDIFNNQVFVAGGANGVTKVSTIQSIDLSVMSANSVSRGNLSALRWLMGSSSGENYGSVIGGVDNGGTALSLIDYIQNSTGTVSVGNRGNLTFARRSPAGSP